MSSAPSPAIGARFERAPQIGAVAVGGFIAITSLVGIFLGVRSGEGWLAIVYGALGVSMGAAGIAAAWMTGVRRGLLLGWFLVGVASRAIVEGDLYLIFISVPIALLLLAALTIALLRRPSRASTLGAAVGGGLSIVVLVALAISAPSFPVICAPAPPQGTSELLISYPFSTPPFDAAERNYILRCLEGARA
jgi:hypothetical protein